MAVVTEYGRLLSHPRHISGYWWRGKPNFGDVLSPLILHWASGCKVLNNNNLPGYRGSVYLAVGSILDGLNIKNAVIWGSGFISNEGRFATEPKQVNAVRGPLTRQIMLDQGVNCPDVYGDPGVLVRRLFDPPLTKEFECGIIPHYLEKSMVPLHIAQDERVNLIDVELPPSEYVHQLCRCKRILSSSLHGLITADAFGISSAHFSLSDLVQGRGFKFNDYYASVGREPISPFNLGQIKELEEVEDYLALADVERVARELMDASPFPSRDRVGT